MIEEDGRGLCYLLGLPRSGTTLLSVLMARHPAVLAPPEPWVMLALEALGGVGARHPAEAYLVGQGVADFTRDLDTPAAAAAAARALYNQHLAASDRQMFVDKTPRYWQITDFLVRAFPAARFVTLIRDPMAVVASLRKTWGFDPLGPIDAGQNEFMRFDLTLGYRRLRDFAAAHPDAIQVRYEALVTDEAAVMAGVFTALGLDPDAALADFDPTAALSQAPIMGDRKILGTRAVHAAAVDVWKTDLSVAEMQAAFDMLGRALFEALGYGATVDALLEMGVVDRGPAVTAEVVAEMERRFARRRRDMDRATRHDPIDGWPFAWREAMDMAHADPTRVVQADYRLNELRESLDAHKAMIARLEGEHAARIEDHRRMVADRDQTIRDHQRLVEERDQTIRDHQRLVAARDEALEDHRKLVWALEERSRREDERHKALFERMEREHREAITQLETRLIALRDWVDAVSGSRSGHALAMLGRLPPLPPS